MQAAIQLPYQTITPFSAQRVIVRADGDKPEDGGIAASTASEEQAMSSVRVLLADDHTIVVEGLASLLKGDFDLVGTVGDGGTLLDAAKRFTPDVIVADISMPVLSGLDALRRLRAEGIDAKVIFLTMH